MTTGFYWSEICFWHSGGNFAGMMPVGGAVQPAAAGGLPEDPETKRRLKNLLDISGLLATLDQPRAIAASDDDILRVHAPSYIADFKKLSEGEGGNLGLRAPFGPGGYDIAAQSAGLAKAAVANVLNGTHSNAYALSRPPGHHCLPDWPNGFCLLANIPIAIEAARAAGLARRFAVLDWDVHHGNGTEAIYLDDPDVLTVSIHQERNYPLDTGGFDVTGPAATNLNIPLPAGTGHDGYIAAMERLALPRIEAFAPEIVIVACGFDAALNDPLGRMLATAETFEIMTRQVMALAGRVCGGRLVLVHEGGYSETYVPFCGHRVIEVLSNSGIHVPDPMAEAFAARQPGPAMAALIDDIIKDMEAALANT